MITTNCWYCDKLIDLLNTRKVYLNNIEYTVWSSTCTCGVPNEFIDFIETNKWYFNKKIKDSNGNVTIINLLDFNN